MIHFILLFSRQGKIRLQKWYEAHSEKEKKEYSRDLTNKILARKPKMSNFLEWRKYQVVYKRYASLFFAFAISKEDNELLTLETIHRYPRSYETKMCIATLISPHYICSISTIGFKNIHFGQKV